MAGGTFDTQNKVRAGVYIRFKSAPQTTFAVGTRGTVAICEPLSWGPASVVNEIDATTDLTNITGYPLMDSHNLFLQEMFKGTNRTSGPAKVLLYRPAGASAASASKTIGNLTATAQYAGTRGNDITIVITGSTSFVVNTVVDGIVVDSQTGATVSDLADNDWVKWSGSGALSATAGAALTGGANGTVSATQHSAFLTAIEGYSFDILCYDGTDSTTLGNYKTFIERLATETGQYAQLVASGMTTPNSRFCINVSLVDDTNNRVVLESGTELTAAQTCWWVAGAQAGAKYNESLTYAQYPGAVALKKGITNAEYITGLSAGKFLLLVDKDGVKVESDIDSLTTYSADIGKVFRKNRVMRLCSQIATDIIDEFSRNFIGVVNNNELGRSRFKGAVVGYLLDIQANNGIQNFDADDVEVLPGTDPDAVVINVAVQVVDAAEKIYLTVEVS